MLRRIVTTYQKHYVEINAKYHCKGCGHRFYRKNKDWFTINPLCSSDFNTARGNTLERMTKKVRQCPKCDTEVKPT